VNPSDGYFSGNAARREHAGSVCRELAVDDALRLCSITCLTSLVSDSSTRNPTLSRRATNLDQAVRTPAPRGPRIESELFVCSLGCPKIDLGPRSEDHESNSGNRHRRRTSALFGCWSSRKDCRLQSPVVEVPLQDMQVGEEMHDELRHGQPTCRVRPRGRSVHGLRRLLPESVAPK
jgi:hypothetical protein